MQILAVQTKGCAEATHRGHQTGPHTKLAATLTAETAMKFCRLAAVALVLTLPRAALCGDLELRRDDPFARATWRPELMSTRIGGTNLSLGLAAGPRPGLRSLSGGDVQPMFPMLSMGLGHNAELALVPRAGRGGSGAMIAIQLKTF
jgi:hypothetical protein